MPRPITPAYPVITESFAEAVQNIVTGADVQGELDKAVKKIDQDIEDNQGYPVPGAPPAEAKPEEPAAEPVLEAVLEAEVEPEATVQAEQTEPPGEMTEVVDDDDAPDPEPAPRRRKKKISFL